MGRKSDRDKEKGGFYLLKVKELVEDHSRDAKCIQLVLDNLNTHFEGSLIETFGPEYAEKVLKKIKFIYTSTHRNRLNRAEIKINILVMQCYEMQYRKV